MKIYGIEMSITAFRKGTKEKFSNVCIKGKSVILNHEILGDIKDFYLKPVIMHLNGHDVHIGSVLKSGGNVFTVYKFSMLQKYVFLKPVSGERGCTCSQSELYHYTFAGDSIEEYNDSIFHIYDGTAKIIGNGLTYDPNYQPIAF